MNRQQVSSYLKRHGYDGLATSRCSCTIDSMSCCSNFNKDCVPARFCFCLIAEKNDTLKKNYLKVYYDED